MFPTCIINQRLSKGSCDTKDWSNGAENSDLHHRNKSYFKVYSNRNTLFLIPIIFHNISVFFCIYIYIYIYIFFFFFFWIK